MNIDKQKALENMIQIQRDLRATAAENQQKPLNKGRIRSQLTELSAAVFGLAHTLEGLLLDELEVEENTRVFMAKYDNFGLAEEDEVKTNG